MKLFIGLASWTAKYFIAFILLSMMLCILLSGCEQKQEHDRPVELLVFHAEWCVNCRWDGVQLDKVRQTGILVTVIDVDMRPDLVSKYNVTCVPTYVLLVHESPYFTTGDINKIIRLFV